MPDLKARLTSKASYESDEPVRVKFDLANREDQDLYILTWYTPLEGLISDCLRVERDGVRLYYDGLLAKRGEPTRENYVLVPAGRKVSNVFDLNSAYDVSDPGNYSVALETEIRDYFFVSPTMTLEEHIAERRQLSLAQSIQSDEERFIVVPSEVPGKGRRLLTKGEEARELAPPPSEEELMLENVGVREPAVSGGTAGHQAQARQAHFDTYDLCVGAMGMLANDNVFREWFGIFSDQRLQRVRDSFSRIKNQMESRTFTYAVSGPDCKINMHAYTHMGITQIWLCDPFWSSPAIGPDSKACTLLHEHSHASASTQDLIYSRDDCRALAQVNPDKAVINASNYEYFAEAVS
jgi:Lysine-specific metallo-endopeptidase